MLKKRISIILVIGLAAIASRFPDAFAQGREYLRTRSGSLAAEEDPSAGKETPSVEYFIAPDDEIDIFVWKNPDLTKIVTVEADGQISYPLIGRMQVAGLTASQLEDKIREKVVEQTKFVSPGDEIEIFVWQNADLSKNVMVDPDGQISYPLIGRMQVTGLTISQLEKEITERLLEYVKHPQVSVTLKKFAGRVSVTRKKYAGQVSVTMKKFSGNKIIVLGEVAYPGIYTYKGAINLIEAVGLAGDFTDKAHSDSVIVVRGNLKENPQVMRINMTKAITRGTSDARIILQPNDVIFVPKTFIANLNKFINDIGPIITTATNAIDLRQQIRQLQGYIR
jgi:polysaccharide export outer membrane protein